MRELVTFLEFLRYYKINIFSVLGEGETQYLAVATLLYTIQVVPYPPGLGWVDMNIECVHVCPTLPGWHPNQSQP